jgi:uncharacterized damage-inducible protein DinB
MQAYILQLMDFNYWANGLIMKYTEKCKTAEFTRDTPGSQNSLRDILCHIMFGEALWLDRMQGKPRTSREMREKYSPTRYPDTKTLYGEWFDLELRMRAFISALSEEQLHQAVRYARADEAEFENTFIDVFTQLAFHGMQHRAEAAIILTDLGHSPGSIDFITYLRSA